MKKVSILILSLFFLTQNPALSAQTGEKQIMIPRSVYVGDTAQLIISFSAKNDFQTGDLLLQNFERPLDSKSYSVKKIILAQTGNASDNQKKYTLNVIFTPWITGEIIIPPYKIGKDFIVYPSPVTIESILTTEKGHKTFVDNKGPLFIPGTTYRILFRLIFLILLAIILIILFCRRKNLSVKYKNFKLIILYSKNKD